MEDTANAKQKLEFELEKLKKQLLNNILELHFLKNDGHIHEYNAWLEKEPIATSILNETNDEDILDDEKFSQIRNLAPPSKTQQPQLQQQAKQPQQVQQQQQTQQPQQTKQSQAPLQPQQVLKTQEPQQVQQPQLIQEPKQPSEPAEHELPQKTLPPNQPLSPQQSQQTQEPQQTQHVQQHQEPKPPLESKEPEVPSQQLLPAQQTQHTHEPISAQPQQLPQESKQPQELVELELPQQTQQPRQPPQLQSGANQQKQFFERAKHEAAVTSRVNELRKLGLWSTKKLPKLQEPPRPKTHWDYLLEEMGWLSTDFAQERRWKKTAAKKCAKMVQKYHQEKQFKIDRAKREHLQHIKKLAASQAKEIRAFWASVEKVVDYRQEAKLKKTRQQALDLHLNYILDHTGKLTHEIQKSMVGDTSLRTSIDDQNESEQDATDYDVEMEVDTITEVDAASLPSDNGTRGLESRNSVDVATTISEKPAKDSDCDSSMDEEVIGETKEDDAMDVDEPSNVSIQRIFLG